MPPPPGGVALVAGRQVEVLVQVQSVQSPTPRQPKVGVGDGQTAEQPGGEVRQGSVEVTAVLQHLQAGLASLCR